MIIKYLKKKIIFSIVFTLIFSLLSSWSVSALNSDLIRPTSYTTNVTWNPAYMIDGPANYATFNYTADYAIFSNFPNTLPTDAIITSVDVIIRGAAGPTAPTWRNLSVKVTKATTGIYTAAQNINFPTQWPLANPVPSDYTKSFTGLNFTPSTFASSFKVYVQSITPVIHFYDIQVRANYTRANFSATYNGNGATSGIVPVDINQYFVGDTVNALGNATLARVGFNFVGWNTSSTGTTAMTSTSMINGGITWYAVWEHTSHTVTWLNFDDTLLETDLNVLYGIMPTYNGTTPTKASDIDFSYIFNSWSPTISPITGDVTYRATFDAFDIAPPIIDPINDITIEATSAAGAIVDYTPTASDNFDPTVTVISSIATGSQFPLGTTQVTLSAMDLAGNIAQPVTFNVNVVDTTAPIITLIDSNPYLVNYASTYIEPGANWADAVDGSGLAIVGSQIVDSLVPGDYQITYNKTDNAGNSADQVTRTVTVLPWSTINVSAIVQNWKGMDNIDPQLFTIQLNGMNGQIISQTTSATFDNLAPGTYTITMVPDNKYTINSITEDNDTNPQNGITLIIGSGEVKNLTFTIWKLKNKIR